MIVLKVYKQNTLEQDSICLIQVSKILQKIINNYNSLNEFAKQIEIKRNKLEKFANDLYKIGICSFDIEYKMINGRIVIIDWDTSFDEMVLEELL